MPFAWLLASNKGTGVQQLPVLCLRNKNKKNHFFVFVVLFTSSQQARMLRFQVFAAMGTTVRDFCRLPFALSLLGGGSD